MTDITRCRIAQHIIDLSRRGDIAEGFDEFDIEVTIKRMETRSDQNLDQMVDSGSNDYSTLLLAACRYTAAINGQQAAQVEMEAATAHLITLEGA